MSKYYSKSSYLWPRVLACALGLILTVLISASRVGSADSIEGLEPEKWSVSLPADLCPGGVHTNCHFGSPTLADIDGDGFLDVIAVTNNGYIAAIRHDGTLLWQTDIAPGFGMAAGTHEIYSSPAVADIDNDGYPEVAVGAGTIHHYVCTQGGVIVLDHNGGVQPGWPKFAYDGHVVPPGCTDSIVSSPALGDLDNDGDMEIVVGGFDKRIYAWEHDGTLLPGFPPDSFHAERFPTWPTLEGLLADDVWSSPSLADIDGDGFLDIVSGTGEGNFDERYGGDANGWVCPYETPPVDGSPGYCGGSIYALNRFGEILPGFPRYFLESMVSSLAMADVNDDGAYEMFIGFSDYYYSQSPDHPTFGFRLLGLDSYANDLPGWVGGKEMGGVSSMSPAIGDIAGDSEPEVVTLGGDGKLYAWHVDGTSVGGFPMTPLDMWGGTPNSFNSYTGLILADFDGDPKMEIFFNHGWTVNVVDGTGQQLTNSNYPRGNAPVYYGDGVLASTPAVGDIDNDGQLELIATNSTARAWDLENASSSADWPMFKHDAQHHGRISRKTYVDTAPDQLLIMDYGSPDVVYGAIRVQNLRSGAFNWTATASENISLSPNSGSLALGEMATVIVAVTASGLEEGSHFIGDVEFEGHMIGEVAEPGFVSVPVTLYLGPLNKYYTPIISP